MLVLSVTGGLSPKVVLYRIVILRGAAAMKCSPGCGEDRRTTLTFGNSLFLERISFYLQPPCVVSLLSLIYVP